MKKAWKVLLVLSCIASVVTLVVHFAFWLVHRKQVTRDIYKNGDGWSRKVFGWPKGFMRHLWYFIQVAYRAVHHPLSGFDLWAMGRKDKPNFFIRFTSSLRGVIKKVWKTIRRPFILIEFDDD